MAKKQVDDSDEESALSPEAVIARVERLSRLMRQASHAEGLVPVQWEALRYLARANRFSNSPGAMARYLGTTKGTISQTVQALEKRELVKKAKSGADTRIVSLQLTEKAQGLLAKDPRSNVTKLASELGGKTAKRFARAVEFLLEGEVARQDEPSFGTCETCRHCDLRGDQTLLCRTFDVELSEKDIDLLCIRHTSDVDP